MGTIQNGLDLVDVEYAGLGGVDGTDRSYAGRPWTQTLRAAVPADLATTAGATIAMGAPRIPTYPFGGAVVAARFRVASARVVFGGGVTASDAANAVLTVTHYTSAGASPTAAAAITTATVGGGGTGTVVAGQVASLVVTGANATMAVDGTIALVVTKTGAGVTLPAGTVVEVDLVPVA